MVHDPIVIFSDSDVLINDIEYAFREKYDFIHSESIIWIKDYLSSHPVKLMIVDMDIDMHMESAAQIESFNCIKELDTNGISFLFLISERKKLELERASGTLCRCSNSDWLVKPFSRNTILQSVNRIYN